jgi:glutamate transport system permease protein
VAGVEVLVDNFDLFWHGFLTTFQLCILSAVGALILGALIAVLRISPLLPLRMVGTAYVTVFRNVPLTVVFALATVALPHLGSNADFLRIPGLTDLMKPLGLDLPYFRFAVIALIVYTSAFVCEALRSGINGVAAGQAEAARSLGLTFSQNLRYVVLPQAWKYAIVPLGSVIIAMLKNSALAGIFGVSGDLMYVAENLSGGSGADVIVVFLGVSLGFLIMTVPLGLLLDQVEKRRRLTA